MTQLYVLANEYRAAASRLLELDLDEQTVADTLEGLSGELETKAVSVAMVARNLEAAAAAIKAAEQEMAARRKAVEARADGLRRYLKSCMEGVGITRIECPHFVLSIKSNPKSVVIDDEAQLPVEFMRQPAPPPAEPDKKAIKVAIEAGREVAGARLSAGTRLDIR
ncbi:MAG: siphovirus Gp157 family protein [Mycobacterium sp.]|nr:siphovirus Gp157 family protein [Mycobacterium sp.]